MKKTSVTIKRLASLVELEDMQALERAVWGMETIPVHQTFTAAKNGGLILGAYVDGEIAGVSYGFPGFRNGQTYLCSHILGIHLDFQKQGIGRLLKEEQRRAALALGYSLITWTFDPLLSVNAYLNLHHLRGMASFYSENLYGEMDDRLNQGLPSDRFTVEWWIDSEHVTAGHQWFQDLPLAEEKILRQADSVAVDQHQTWFVPIPIDFQMVKANDPNRALEWRLKTRAIFQTLLKADYVGVDVKRARDCSYYVFVNKDRLAIQERSKSDD